MYEGGRPKNSIELSQSVRRGEIGMAGLAKWLERCFFGLHIPLGMLEPWIEHLIEAMCLLQVFSMYIPFLPFKISYRGASIEPSGPDPPLLPDTPSQISPVSLPTPLGCPGQELPLKEGKSSFLSYPLALHTECELPWSVEFGPKLII
jgi:hypothetical protein